MACFGFFGVFAFLSIANLLRRFDIEVPAQVLRTRNVAAVLVTAEVSPYLRPGGRFDITISSLGDARSFRHPRSPLERAWRRINPRTT